MDELSFEQRFRLRRMREDLRKASRQSLIAAVISAQEALFRQANWHQSAMTGAGIPVHMSMPIDLGLPETPDEMVRVFGKEPTEDELDAYTAQRIEDFHHYSGGDIDIAEIAMEVEGSR